MTTLRHRAVAELEHWYFEREASVVKGAHPLVVVHEMHLEESDGNKAGMHATERRSGSSHPPIRDMDWRARKVDRIMAHIGNVNLSWLRAMELYVEHRTFRNAAAKTKIKASLLFRQFDQGLAVLQSEMVRQGI